MGADGHIKIWKESEVLKFFPKAKFLCNCLPNVYWDELDGIQYVHTYWGDGMGTDFREISDWYIPKGYDVTIDELKEFVSWLDQHGTHWEVWT